MKKVSIGGGQGFWGDSPDAAIHMIRHGNLNYMACDYLAELTLSIMQRQKMKNPAAGYARDPKDYEFLKWVLTVERVKEYFGDMVKGEITRYDADSLCGMNFVMKHALGGGAPHSLRLDTLGKSMGSAFMRMKVDTDW